MAEKKAAINLTGLAVSSACGDRFVQDYSELSGHFEKRSMLFDTVRLGQILRESGLQGLLPLVETPQYIAASAMERQQMIKRYMTMLCGADVVVTHTDAPAAMSGTLAQQAAAPTPPAEEPPAAEEPPVVQPAPPAAAQQPEVVSGKDGSITKTEPETVVPKRPGPGLGMVRPG